MNDRHVQDELSAYIDDALSERERRRVDAHMEKCAECRAELADLRKVSTMVAALPEHELPGGFMARLHARRHREEAAAAPLAWFPLPTKTAALALTGVIACLIFFREVKYRLAPAVLPPAAMSSLELDAKMEKAFPEEREKSGPVAHKGAWSGLAGEDDGASGAAAARGLAGGGGRPESHLNPETAEMLMRAARGERQTLPPAAPPPPRRSRIGNEDLRRFLDAQTKALGIKKIIKPVEAGPVGEESPDQPQSIWSGVENKPMSKDEAKTAMRRMTKNLYEINQQASWKRAPSVPISGRTPKLLTASGGGATRGAAVGAPAAMKAADKFDAGSIAYTGANARSKPKSKQSVASQMLIVKSQVVEKPKRAPAAPPAAVLGMAQAMPAAVKDEAGKSAEAEAGATADSGKEAPAKDRALAWQRSWGGSTGGFGEAGGAVLKTAAEWADLHRRVPFAASLPAADFTQEMAVVIFADRSMTKSRTVEVVSVAEQEGRLLVRYRTAVDEAKDAPVPSAPYHIVVVPRSDLPFTFIQVP
ncbi:MAG: zf-HC2 domain-containing protein [Elusimicrobiota bacterium]